MGLPVDTPRMLQKYFVALTYRCNLSCRWCNQKLDVKSLRWDERSDLGYDTLAEYHKRFETYDIAPSLRVSGGDPLLHPKFERMMGLICEMNSVRALVHVFTNGILPMPSGGKSWSYCIGKKGKDKQGRVTSNGGTFIPTMISPLDLGMKPVNGVVRKCYIQNACGRIVDAHGFSFCVYAGTLGRLLRVDPYHTYPVSNGIPAICNHCPFSLRKKDALKLCSDGRDGKLETPTKTYRDALRRTRKEGTFEMPLFEGR